MASPVLGSPGKLAPISAPIFQHDRFTAHQRIFTFKPQFHFRDIGGSTLAFVQKKVFSWKDEIRIFTDETHSMELLTVKARKIIDWGAAFDVTDSINHQNAGTLKRRGWKSLVRSEWIIADPNGQEIGRIRENSTFLAFLRRLLSNLLPQTYSFEVLGQQVGRARQKLNFFVPRMEADFSTDLQRLLDRRLAVAAVVLLMTMEGRQGA